MQAEIDRDLILRRVDRWIASVVIGLQLCPFAGKALRRGQLDTVLIDSAQAETCLQVLVEAAEQLAQGDPGKTTLLVLGVGFADFDDYLDLLALGEALLSDRGFDGIIQLASFHPDYCFEGSPEDDPGNWTNRSPYPMLHLLTEASISQAVRAHPDPQSIPQANVQTLSRLGVIGIEQLMKEQ